MGDLLGQVGRAVDQQRTDGDLPLAQLAQHLIGTHRTSFRHAAAIVTAATIERAPGSR